jgi:endoglucanase
VAINWNSPVAYLAGAIEALNSGVAPSFAVDGVIVSIPKVRPGLRAADGTPKLRFDNHRVFIENNGIRYDLKGKKLK